MHSLQGPEMTEPRWPGRYGSGLSVSLQGVTADTISHLATELGSRITLLDTDGPEVTEPRWPEWHRWGLSVSLQGVAADTISYLADLGRTVRLLEIYDCPDHMAGSLEPLTRCRGLQDLSVTAADLPLLRGQLPEGLSRLNVRGPEVTEPRWPGRSPWGGLSVSLQGVAADTISHLADLGRRVRRLEIYDCSDLTAGSLEPLTRCPELLSLTLSGGVPDTVSLEPLTRCRELWELTLSGGVPDTVSLEPLTRLVKSCRELYSLYLHCTADTGRAVLTALKEADLRRSNGEPRTIYLRVPGELYWQLMSQGGDGVEVRKWY
ncbi:hypothetical protein FJT64_026659 [Amphibalanus amphitrite]|uniref:Uncharacterized protein n=1 Tax=Amphibalanus amphitrite TaxID=1232801 RepID=A0A6A4WFZ4_AMPAM|nr:hypothetical protein FJT64_026659 [Amphibalanus amphitrite]